MGKIGFIIFIILFLCPNGSIGFGDIHTLDLEVVEETGSWNITSPMFLNTTDTDDPVYAKINATNIDVNDSLEYLQYFTYTWEILDHSDPSATEYQKLYHYLWMEIGNTQLNYTWYWRLYGDVITTFNAEFDLFVNDTHLIDKIHTGESSTDKLEFHLWRSKSNQIMIEYKAGDDNYKEFIYQNILPSWDLVNITYSWESVETEELAFTVFYTDMTYQHGSNEGIADPVSNEDWGIFEPIRQILLFILNLFMTLVKVILPSDIEDMFDHFLDKIDDYIGPVFDVIVWLGNNFLDFLIIINLFLLVNGIESASKGEYINVVQPFWKFYSTLIGFIFRIMGFVLSVIRALVGAIPFI